MKTKFYYIIMCLAVTLGTMSITSCGNDDEAEPAQSEWGSLKNNGYAGTGNADNTSSHKATIKGSIKGAYGPAYSYIGIEYSTSPSFSRSEEERTNSGLINGDKYTVLLDNLKPSTTYYYRSCVVCGGMKYVGDTRSFATTELNIATTGYVDFGRTLGKWAACNLGASTPNAMGEKYTSFPFDYSTVARAYEVALSPTTKNWSGTSYDFATKANSATKTPVTLDIEYLLEHDYEDDYYRDVISYRGVRGYALTPKKDDKTMFIPFGKYVTAEATTSDDYWSVGGCVDVPIVTVGEFDGYGYNTSEFHLYQCFPHETTFASKNAAPTGYIRPKYK